MGEARRRKLRGDYPSQERPVKNYVEKNVVEFPTGPRSKGFCFSIVDGAIVMTDPVDITSVKLAAANGSAPGYMLDGKPYLDVSGNYGYFLQVAGQYMGALKIFSRIANALEDANRCGYDRDNCVCFIAPMNKKHPELFGIALTYSIGSASHNIFSYLLNGCYADELLTLGK